MAGTNVILECLADVAAIQHRVGRREVSSRITQLLQDIVEARHNDSSNLDDLEAHALEVIITCL